MFAIVALVAAVLFVILAVWRFAPSALPQVGIVSMAAAVIGGLAGLVYWHMIGDTRWLVGAVLMLASLVLAALAPRNRALHVAAVVVGLLGAVLFVLAYATGYHPA